MYLLTGRTSKGMNSLKKKNKAIHPKWSGFSGEDQVTEKDGGRKGNAVYGQRFCLFFFRCVGSAWTIISAP